MIDYKISLSETQNGEVEYLQIMSSDLMSVNIVLIGQFEIEDSRPRPEKEQEPALEQGDNGN